MAAMQRHFGRVRRYAQAFWPGLDLSSVQPVHGDLTAPQLGMPASTYRSLQRQVTQIIPAAGCVHLEQLAHVSTAFVAGDHQGITENDLYCGQQYLKRRQKKVR